MYNYTITILIVLLNPNQIEMIRRIAAKPSCRLQAADHWDRLTVHTVQYTHTSHYSCLRTSLYYCVCVEFKAHPWK